MPIRRLRVDEVDALTSFVRPFVGESFDLATWCAEAFENPFSPGECTSWIAWENDRAVAHLRASVCPAYYNGKAIVSAWWNGVFAQPFNGTERSPAAGQLAMRVLREPHAHAIVGTPGVDSKAFKLYRALGFEHWGAVPFLYMVLNGARVLRELEVFSRNRTRTLISHAASHALLPGKLLQVRHWRPRRAMTPEVQLWDNFPESATEFWQLVSPSFALIFDRSAPYLNWRYRDNRYDRCALYRAGRLLGWCICKTTQMENNKYFGNLRVGTIVDLLTHPDDRLAIRRLLSAAVQRLRAKQAELIVTNLSHRHFLAAASEVGFLQGPSTYQFLTRNLPRIQLDKCHLTRGDNDGDNAL